MGSVSLVEISRASRELLAKCITTLLLLLCTAAVAHYSHVENRIDTNAGKTVSPTGNPSNAPDQFVPNQLSVGLCGDYSDIIPLSSLLLPSLINEEQFLNSSQCCRERCASTLRDPFNRMKFLANKSFNSRQTLFTWLNKFIGLLCCVSQLKKLVCSYPDKNWFRWTAFSEY